MSNGIQDTEERELLVVKDSTKGASVFIGKVILNWVKELFANKEAK